MKMLRVLGKFVLFVTKGSLRTEKFETSFLKFRSGDPLFRDELRPGCSSDLN